jgi:hypothetical protein
LKESQVITGKDWIKQKQYKDKELALFLEAREFSKGTGSLKMANIDQNSIHSQYIDLNSKKASKT